MSAIQLEMSEKAKQARRAYARSWREKNKDHVKEYNRTWRAENKDKIEAARVRYWERIANEQDSAAVQIGDDQESVNK